MVEYNRNQAKKNVKILRKKKSVFTSFQFVKGTELTTAARYLPQAPCLAHPSENSFHIHIPVP